MQFDETTRQGCVCVWLPRPAVEYTDIVQFDETTRQGCVCVCDCLVLPSSRLDSVQFDETTRQGCVFLVLPLTS